MITIFLVFGINRLYPRFYPKIMADYYNSTLIAQNFFAESGTVFIL